MSTRRNDKTRGRLGRRRGFSIESLERRELLTAASQTFIGPSLTTLLTEAKHGQNTAPAVITKMVTALQTQMDSGPLADFTSGAVTSNGFIVEAQNLELSFEQDLITQKLAGAFPKIDIDQLLRLQGQNVVAGLEADNEQASVGLIAGSSLSSAYQSTIHALTAGPIHAIGTASSVPASLTQSFRNGLNLVSNDLGNGSLTLDQVNTTISAEAEAYRAQIHAALQVSDPSISGKADTRINALENSISAIASTAPADASSQVAAAIKSFVNSTLDTTGLFGSKGAFSKGPKNVTQHPLATLGQGSSVVTKVSGATGTDGTATLTAMLTDPNGSPIMGQNVAFTLDGAFAGVASTNFVGVATLPEVFTTDAPGTDTSGIFASFASNTNFLASYSTGNLTVNAVATAISSVSGTGIYGGTATLQATLTNQATSQAFAGQTVSFSIDGNTVGTAVTNSAGVATLSGVTTTNGAGTDSGGIVASYAGSNSFASSSNQGNLVVSQAGTTLSAVSGTAGIGGTATLTATLTSNVTNVGIAGETVSFTLDGTSVGTGTTNASGVATLSGVPTSDAIGTDTGGIVASFAGDTNYSAASNATGNLVVSLNSTTISSVSGTATIGGLAALTATLTSGSTGSPISGKTLSFTLDGKSVGTAVTSSTGVATINGLTTTDGIGVDTNGVVVSFAGDSTNAASTGTGNLVVSQAGTTLTTSGSAVAGGSATLTATLISAVTGLGISGQTIAFNLDGKLFGSGQTNSAGIATVTGVATQSTGTDTGGVVATFMGSLNYGTSTATGNLVVAANASTLSNASGNVSYGGTATLTATLTDPKTSAGISGQTISFTLDGKSVGTSVTNSSGVATLAGVATTDAVGTDANGVIATFAGNTTYGASSSTGDLNVLQAATTLGGVTGTALFGGTATLSATLTSSVTGLPLAAQTVTFKLDGTSVGTAFTNQSGLATLSGVATTHSVGTDSGGVVASFAGTTNYGSTTGTGNLVVTGDSSTITSVAGTASFGGTATLTAKLTNPVNNDGIAGKTVAFSLDGGLVGTAVTDSNGIATLSNVTTTQAVGTDSGGVVAKFAGDSSYAASNGTGSLVVSKAATTLSSVSGTSFYGGMATLTSTLTSSVTTHGIADETVTFRFNGTVVGTAVTNSAGVATLTGVSTLTGVEQYQPAGTDTGGVTVSFAGDSNYGSSNGTGDLVVSKADTNISNISGTAFFGGLATLTAQLNSPDAGQLIVGQTVNFTLDGVSVGTAVTDSVGKATLNGVATADLAGTDTGGIVASFAGNSNYLAAANATGDLVVSKADTNISNISGTAFFGGPATLTAQLDSTVTNLGIAGETLSFTLDGVSVGTAVTNGSGLATLTGVQTSDAVGVDQGGVVVSYSGDANYNSTGSRSSALVVSKAATTLSNVSGTDISGQAATLTATLLSSVTNVGIADQTVTFKLDGTTVGTATTNASGVATLTGVDTTDAAGTDTGGVVVNYAGTSSYEASDATGDLTVNGLA